MIFLVLGAFLAVVVFLAWHSHRQGLRPTSCCAPPDPRHDLRMRPAFEDGPRDT